LGHFYNREEYEPITSVELDNLVAELPFDLLRESIYEQINNPLSTNVDYIDSITEKADEFRDIYGDNEEIIEGIDNAMNDFFINILSKLSDRFNLDLDLTSIANRSDIVDIGQALYEYFILRYTKNITKYISKYINTHKKEFTNYYADKNKKDVSTLVYKKQFKNPDDLTIISNLSSIINYIISLEMENEEFIELSAGKNNYNASVVKDLINEDILNGDFVRTYIDLCTDEYDYVIDDIFIKIRQKYINKNLLEGEDE